jgi:hypothetical protein
MISNARRRKLARAPITPNKWLEQLPAGPAPLPADPLDRVVTLLERETNSHGLHGRLVSLGWTRPDGTQLEWWQHEIFRR